MSDNRLLKKGRFIGLLSIFILAALIAVQILASFHFHVVSTDPNIKKFSNAVPFFKINFNRTLSTSNVKVTSSPSIISSYSVSGKTLDLSLLPLSVGKTYAITLQSIADSRNQTITNQVFSFVAQAINPSGLPTDQRQAILRNQESYPAVQSNPIFKYLPYQTLSYSLTGQINGPEVIVNAKLYIDEAEVSNEMEAVAQTKQEVISYIQSIGLNPSNYNIVYTVVTP